MPVSTQVSTGASVVPGVGQGQVMASVSASVLWVSYLPHTTLSTATLSNSAVMAYFPAKSINLCFYNIHVLWLFLHLYISHNNDWFQKINIACKH